MSSFSSPAVAGVVSRTLTVAEGCDVTGQSAPTQDVGATATQQCRNVTPLLTDEQREAAIERAGKLVEKYVEVWSRDGCFAARGLADHAAWLMKQLINGRSPEVVARLERERGLA